MAGLPHQASEAYGSEGYGDAYAYGSEAAAAPLGAGAGVGAGAGADDAYGRYGGDDAYAYGAYFTQVVSLPAGLVHGIMSFLTGNDLRALGATCTSALALACEHITHLTVRVPKTKLLQPMFRTTLPRYGAVTHITGAVRVWVLGGSAVAMLASCVHLSFRSRVAGRPYPCHRDHAIVAQSRTAAHRLWTTWRRCSGQQRACKRCA